MAKKRNLKDFRLYKPNNPTDIKAGPDIINNSSQFKLDKIRNEQQNEGFDAYKCLFCKRYVRLSGNGENRYFAHKEKGTNCEIVDQKNLTKAQINALNYSICNEGPKHKKFKNKIERLLENNPNIKDIQKEKWITDPEMGWSSRRKPDLNFLYKEKRIALEIQVSQNFISVFEEREKFYKDQGMHLIWLLDLDEIEQDRLYCKDIFIRHPNYNVFFYSEELYNENHNDFIFGVIWPSFDHNNSEIKGKNSGHISLDNLIFNDIEESVYPSYNEDFLKQKKLFKNIIKSRLTDLSNDINIKSFDLYKNYKKFLDVNDDSKLNIMHTDIFKSDKFKKLISKLENGDEVIKEDCYIDKNPKSKNNDKVFRFVYEIYGVKIDVE